MERLHEEEMMDNNEEVDNDFSYSSCPCMDNEETLLLPRRHRLPMLFRRYLQTTEESPTTGETWEIVYTCVVLLWMFVALLSDRIGADSVMITALTAFMAARIITVEEGLIGFSNEGLLTVLVLFVVAEGISKTGALDWYMSKLLGRPKSTAGAQMRLMAPIAVVSAFLNNTPVVAVMIPIVQKWARNIKVSAKQLLVPLSFASILGGTCTLIGTSTNLVVAGLLQERYPDDPNISIGLFDLGEYGVPVAMAGIAYILLMSPCLLPGGKRQGSKDKSGGDDDDDDLLNADGVLLGARLTQWSPAAGRTVQRSGLRDTGGIYLVSVHRVQTGNVHRAVSNDFVLNVGDVLYFTGLIESFGEFCEEHGLEVLTNEVESDEHFNKKQQATNNNNDGGDAATDVTQQQQQQEWTVDEQHDNKSPTSTGTAAAAAAAAAGPQQSDLLMPIVEDHEDIPQEVGITKESLMEADAEERLRSIHRMTDLIRNAGSAENNPSALGTAVETTTAAGPIMAAATRHHHRPAAQQRNALAAVAAAEALKAQAPAKIVVTSEKDLVVVGINARDRPGLLLDLSKGLAGLELDLHHTEAAVIGDRSVSIWRCQVIGTEFPDLEEIWTVLSALLSTEDAGLEAMKKRGLRVIRARVIRHSRLIGKTAAEVNFRQFYKAAIITIQKKASGVNLTASNISNVRLDIGDVLILQVSDDSPLLTVPPKDFYNKKKKSDAKDTGTEEGSAMGSRSSSVQSLVNMIRRRSNSSSNLMEVPDSPSGRSNGPSAMSNIVTTSSAPASPAPSSSNLNVSGGAVDDSEDNGDFFIPMGDDDIEDGTGMSRNTSTNNLEADLEDDYDGDNDPAAAFRQAQREKVWKDLQVIFTKTRGGGGGGNNGDDASNASNFQPAREFLTAMAIAPNSKFAGKTAAQAGINKLPDLFLVSIDRPVLDLGGEPEAQQRNRRPLKGRLISVFKKGGATDTPPVSDGHSSVMTENITFTAVAPEEPLQEGDVLWFSGSASAVGDLRKIPGLISNENEEVEKIDEKLHDRRLVQAVIARKGPLVGKTVKEVRFRTRYGAAVIAVHREGHRVHEHPGRVKLHAGDVLLLEAGPSFIAKSGENDRSFALLAEVEDSAPPRLSLLIPALLLTAAMLAVYTAGVASLLITALVASILMVFFGILSEQEARDAINWDVYITIAAAFGIGLALVNSGVAGGVAGFLVAIGEGVGLGDAGLLGAVYFATFLISNVVTNNAAAALIFPIAMDAAEQTGVDVTLMAYAVMLGASASFMSPFGYTTNLLIYGPGGYKYKDFVVFGTPMQLVLWVLSTLFLVIRPWYISWIATAFVLLIVTFFRVVNIPLGNLFSLGKGKADQQTTEDDLPTTEETAEKAAAP